MSPPHAPDPASPETPTRASTREAERRIGAGAGRAELARRLRQQAVLSDFGGLALQCHDLDILLQRACELCADGLQTPYAKVLEWKPDANCFLIRAGVGWAPGVVGRTLIGADLDSPAGFAFHTGAPVISNHLGHETRFRTPALLAEHGVKRALNVLIQAGEEPAFGVLEADTPEEGRFDETDQAFLQGFAHLLGVAIERDRADARRRAADEAVRASEERFRLITHATADVLWDWDLTTHVITWSEAMCELVGEGAMEPTLGWWAEQLHPEDRDRVVESLHAAVEGPAERWREEYRFRRADGTWADIVDQGFILRDAQGRAARMVGGMLDVTGLKRVEAELRETQERLQAALDAAEMGALEFDPASGALHLDERCLRLLGLPPDAEMTYRRLLRCVEAEARPVIAGAVRQALDPAGPREFEIELGVRSVEDGTLHWIAARGRALTTARRTARIVGIAFDVTYRKRAEQLMRDALEHQAMLVREVSHRVKNSLQLVAGVLALQARATPHEEVRQALTVAQTRLQTIGQVHDQLWRQPDMQEVELAGFLRSLCDKLQESALGHALTFTGETASVSTDRAIPVALLVNELVTNAFKYAYPGGSGPVDVSLARAEGDRLVLTVADHGVGLPPELAVTDTRQSLGMKVVTGLVRQLRAELEVGSNHPGARFVLRFGRTDPDNGTA